MADFSKQSEKGDKQKMIMDELQRSMQTKLRWLNCKVSVVDTDTYNNKIFNRVRRNRI